MLGVLCLLFFGSIDIFSRICYYPTRFKNNSMFTKRFFSLALLSVLVFSGSLAFAQDLPEEIVLEENTLTAVIDADRVVMVGRSIIFDASDTFNPEEDKDLTYEWHLGDGNRQQGVEIVHSYGEPGEYQVTLVVRNIDGEQDTITHEVFVYERTFLLITDNSEESEKLTSLVDYAKQQGVFVNLIGSFGEASEFLSEEALLQQYTNGILRRRLLK